MRPLDELRNEQLLHLQYAALVECGVDMLEWLELVVIVDKLDIVELVGKHVVDMIVSVVDRIVVVADNELVLVGNKVLLQGTKFQIFNQWFLKNKENNNYLLNRSRIWKRLCH